MSQSIRYEPLNGPGSHGSQTSLWNRINFMSRRHSVLIRNTALAGLLLSLFGILWAFGSLGGSQTNPPPVPETTGTPRFPPRPAPTVFNGLSTDDIVLCMKSGATVIWDRMPVHVGSTLSKVPNVMLFSDQEEQMGPYKVIDILANVTESLRAKHPQFKLYRELQRFKEGNLAIKDAKLEGGWDLDKFKFIPMLRAARIAYPNAKWIVTIEADSHIIWENMVRWLSTLDYRKPLYLGSGTLISGDLFAHGGTGYVISGAACDKAKITEDGWDRRYEKLTLENCCGDHVLSKALADSGQIKLDNSVPMFQGEPFWNMRINDWNWCSPVLTFHHVNARDIPLLWNFEQLNMPKDKGYILYSDLYHEFIQHRLVESRVDWDNRADNPKYKGKVGKDDQPGLEVEKYAYFSKEHCVKACNAWNKCLSWRFEKADNSDQENYCGLMDTLNIGQVTEHATGRITSGSMLERIESVRKAQSCEHNLPGISKVSSPMSS